MVVIVVVSLWWLWLCSDCSAGNKDGSGGRIVVVVVEIVCGDGVVV